MDAWWKWLMRANARGVFSCAVAALLLVSAWWTWKELEPPGKANVFAAQATAAGPMICRVFSDVGLALDATLPLKNPFFPPGSFRPRPQLTTVREPEPAPEPEPEPVIVVAPEPEPAPEPAPPEPGPPEPGPPKPVTPVFRGVFKRMDGQAMVLLHDPRTGKQRYYAVGDKLHDLTIETIHIRRGAVMVRRNDGTSMTLDQKGKVEDSDSDGN